MATNSGSQDFKAAMCGPGFAHPPHGKHVEVRPAAMTRSLHETTRRPPTTYGRMRAPGPMHRQRCCTRCNEASNARQGEKSAKPVPAANSHSRLSHDLQNTAWRSSNRGKRHTQNAYDSATRRAAQPQHITKDSAMAVLARDRTGGTPHPTPTHMCHACQSS